jgi:hypothetical protein
MEYTIPGMRRAILLASALVLVALVGASGYVLMRRHDDEVKRRRTYQILFELVELIRKHDLGETTVDSPPPRATGTRDDPTGMKTLQEWLMGGHYIMNSDPETPGGKFLRGELSKDAWGRPIRYRSPGTRFKSWEVSSLGPYGLEEEAIVAGYEPPAQVSSSSW